MSTNKGPNARALVEPLSLDSHTLEDSDLSALSLSHSNEQYTSNDFEAFANIQAELDCMNAEEVMAADDDRIVIRQNIETDTVPDVEMTEVSDQVQSEHVYTMANQNNQNIVFQTKPALQRVPVSAVQVMRCIEFYDVVDHQDLSHVNRLSDEAKRLPNHSEPIDHDSITRERAGYQSDPQDIAPTDSFGRAVTVLGADSHNWQICGWKRRSDTVESTCQVYRDNQFVGEHHDQ